jgi:hypothetical protein
MIAEQLFKKNYEIDSFEPMCRPKINVYSFLLAGILPISLFAQNLTGVWRGYFITDQFEQYKFEIQIEHNGPTLQGVSYSYLNTVFYGKAALKGSYESGGKRLRLQETHTIEIKMSDGSHSCIMDCNLNFVRSGKEEFLEGTYTSQFEKSAPGIRKGADCGDGKVYLRRVTESDFYLEPFLKNQARNNKPVFDNQAPPSRAKVNPPMSKKTDVPARPQNNSNPAGLASSGTPQTKKTNLVPPTEPETKPVVEPTPQIFKTRENELAKEIIVNSRLIQIRLYDNGEIDGDTISVFVGNKLTLSKKRLTATPLELKIELPAGQDTKEITLIAENLGSIPPNTSLMIVEAGDQRHDVRITSTEQKNAVVRFRYRPN